MKIFCFIFARGGSKRLKNKNLRLVNKKPLIWYSITLAKKIKKISKIFVSTDSKTIIKYSKKLNVNIIKRPKILAADKSNEILSWKHAIEYAQNNFGKFDFFLCLPTTSPLRTVADIKKIIKALSKNFDLSIGITKSLKNPYFNMVLVKKNRLCKIVNSKKHFYRNQDAPSVFDITTVAYFSKPDYITSLNLKNNLMKGKVVGTQISRINSIDIDTQYDLELANYYFKKYKYKSKS